jgi:hypothetical protein|tara:strand:- start:128 stop:292 length:165 start_codon:yes stop_codon:yes gene_type:complete
MFYEGILQLKIIMWAAELKANHILGKIKAGNKPGSVPTTVSRDHLSGTTVTDSL